MQKKHNPLGLISVSVWSIFFLLNAALSHAKSVEDPNDQRVAQTYSAFLNATNASTQLFPLNQKAGQEGTVKTQPWSGYYWPLLKGSVASPKQDWKNFLGMMGKFQKFERRFQNRMQKISEEIDQLSPNEIEDFGPSEKYDLYLGDASFSLTHAIWQSARESFNRFGKIENWEGSCQGWSSASIFSPRPEKLITVMSLDGKYLIPFYPDDLKALETLVWANSYIQDATVFAGSRCYSGKPEIDRPSGHVIDENCRGVNPGVFHLGILQLIGVQKTSFIVNRNQSTEVWNQPISGYSFTYFNPKTLNDGDLQSSIVPLSALPHDPFARFRNAKTKSLVGVNMTISYIHGSHPSHSVEDSERNDKIRTLDFTYDLELSEQGEVLGGEWISQKEETPEEDPNEGEANHGNTLVNTPSFPGFIWRFKYDEPIAFSIVDPPIGTDIHKLDRSALITLHQKAVKNRYTIYRYDAQGHNAGVLYQELKPQALSIVVNDLVKMSRDTQK